MYRTNYLLLAFLATLAIGVGYLACTLKQISYPEPMVGKYEKKEKLEKTKVGDLEVSYPKNVELKVYNETLLDLDTKKKFSVVDRNTKTIVDYFPVKIFSLKDENSKKLFIKEWWEKQGPQNQRQADYPIREEVLSINGIDAYKTTYLLFGEQSNYLGIQIYIPHNTDIYEIRGYQLPETPNPALTPDDIQAAHEYEAIFNQILQSIKFVDSEPANGLGTLTGKVTIGPNCPVEQVGHPCLVPPSAYSSRQVVIYSNNKTTVVTKAQISSTGTYTVTLPPGNYYAQLSPAGIGPGELKPLTITADQTTTLDFDVDTGIR